MRNNKYSNLKIAQHPAKLDSFRRGEITAPLYVRVKPINLCNHGCRWCTYKADRKAGEGMEAVASDMHTGMKERDILPAAKMFEVLDDFKHMGVKAITYSGGGEPLMHRDIVGFMERTLRFGIALSIITNGQMLHGEKAAALAYAKWVRVSMDYTTAAQMMHSRLTPERMFGEVLFNLREFAAIKQPDCDLGVNFIVHRENCHDLAAFARELKALGVENIRFSPVVVPNLVEYHEPLKVAVESQLRQIHTELSSPRFSVNSTYDIHARSFGPERAYTKCFFTQTVPVIGADQRVYACHNKAYDPTGMIGSIQDRSFEDLWFSAEAKTFFETLNPQCTCRHQCANDAKNENIQNLLSASADDFV